MHQFEGLRIFLFQHHACFARVFHLTEEGTEFHPSLVIDVCLREETAAVSTLEDAGTQVDVLAVAHGSKSSQSLIDIFPDTEVETAGVELVQLLFAAAYATCGEKRGHGIVDGFLYGRERWVSPVGAAKGVAGVVLKLLLDGFQIAFGDDDV